MKPVILSADGDSVVYTVPDAGKYRVNGVVCYNEQDFINYLNTYRFPEEPSALIRNLGWTGLGETLPPEYRDLPYFNF